VSAGRGLGLSSRTGGSKPIAVRLPNDLAAAVEQGCAEQGVTPSELIRGLVAQWAYGTNALAGPDAGYTEARSMATRLAYAALAQALESLPEEHSAARAMLEGHYNRKE
jgi:hypothetical protein